MASSILSPLLTVSKFILLEAMKSLEKVVLNIDMIIMLVDRSVLSRSL